MTTTPKSVMIKTWYSNGLPRTMARNETDIRIHLWQGECPLLCPGFEVPISPWISPPKAQGHPREVKFELDGTPQDWLARNRQGMRKKIVRPRDFRPPTGAFLGTKAKASFQFTFPELPIPELQAKKNCFLNLGEAFCGVFFFCSGPLRLLPAALWRRTRESPPGRRDGISFAAQLDWWLPLNSSTSAFGGSKKGKGG